MFKRIGLSAAALLAAIALMQTPASAQNRNYGGASGHYTSNRYMPSVQSYTPFAQNPLPRRAMEQSSQEGRLACALPALEGRGHRQSGPFSGQPYAHWSDQRGSWQL